MKIEIPHIESLADVLIDHLDFFSQNKCFAFVGEMGAGKTTIIQKILNLNGVKNLQGSPTYSIINEYETEEGIILYHLDCYRIKNNAEAFELGIEELLSKKNNQSIKFRWIDEPKDTFFELKIIIDDITQDISLIITDFAEDEEDEEEAKLLWSKQIEKLRQSIGS